MRQNVPYPDEAEMTDPPVVDPVDRGPMAIVLVAMMALLAATLLVSWVWR